ncbi:MAG: hypothetical protein IT450_14600 [Phycisphaerales bacterium]|nr:hypothetical protein [Phycisphaerales bacterium]
MKRKVSFSALTLSDLRECPVWEFDDYNEALVPVPEHSPLRHDGTRVVLARLTAPGGQVFDGTISPPEDVDVVSIFASGREVIFNRYLSDEVAERLDWLFRLLECDPFPVFPLKYETGLSFLDGERIEGIVDIRYEPTV